MNILYGILDWGLGHATRSLPVIRELVRRGHAVTVLSSGEALRLLRTELPDAPYRELPAYPLPYTEDGFSVLRTLLQAPRIVKTIRDEQERTRVLATETAADRIVSDSRYGVYAPDRPSFLITHQLRLISPGRIAAGEYLFERINRSYYRNFTAVLVPDAAKGGLSGDLSHDLSGNTVDIRYIGHLTDAVRSGAAADIDTFITLSGPEPQRSAFARKVLAQARSLPGKTVVALADQDGGEAYTDGSVEIHPFLSRARQADCMNRARAVVSRSGYTTLMELAELGKKAVVIPTPGQTEQEYLAAYHRELGTWHGVAQDAMDLVRDVPAGLAATGYVPPRAATENVRVAVDIIEHG